MIELGDKVKDKITPFSGIVIGVTSWLNGCRTIGIKALALANGKPQDAYWLDENQLEIVKKKAKVIKPIVYKDVEKTGGPHEIPQKSIQPK